jgi:hypothetical protein
MLESAYANASYCLVQGRGRLGQASSEGSSIGLEMFLPFVFFHPLVIFASTSPFFFLVNLISSRWDLVVGNGDCFVTGPIELGNLLGYISVFVMYDSWETLKCAENSFFFLTLFCFFLSRILCALVTMSSFKVLLLASFHCLWRVMLTMMLMCFLFCWEEIKMLMFGSAKPNPRCHDTLN